MSEWEGRTGEGEEFEGAYVEPAWQNNPDSDIPGLELKNWPLVRAADVSASPPEWLTRGAWVAGSYGQIAGMEKSLKSWLALEHALSVASGLPLFGDERFEIRRPGRVVIFNGEGSSRLARVRLEHLAKAKGVSLCDLPLWIVSGVGPSESVEFQHTMFRAVLMRPSLIVVDPLYAYHGAEADASNVHEASGVLNTVAQGARASEVQLGHQISLQIVNHLRKSGARKTGDAEGPELADITQAGSREWVDSWWLVWAHEKPDLAAGRFVLGLKMGSRHGWGTSYRVTAELGEFDIERINYSGIPQWEVDEFSGKRGGIGLRGELLQLIREHPREYTRQRLKSELKYRQKDIVDELAVLVERGFVVVEKVAYTRSDGKNGMRDTFMVSRMWMDEDVETLSRLVEELGDKD